jgi:hypothetical protein
MTCLLTYRLVDPRWTWLLKKRRKSCSKVTCDSPTLAALESTHRFSPFTPDNDLCYRTLAHSLDLRESMVKRSDNTPPPETPGDRLGKAGLRMRIIACDQKMLRT